MILDNQHTPMNACIKAFVGPITEAQTDYDQPEEKDIHILTSQQ